MSDIVEIRDELLDYVHDRFECTSFTFIDIDRFVRLLENYSDSEIPPRQRSWLYTRLIAISTKDINNNFKLSISSVDFYEFVDMLDLLLPTTSTENKTMVDT